jgi:hypothetical protein
MYCMSMLYVLYEHAVCIVLDSSGTLLVLYGKLCIVTALLGDRSLIREDGVEEERGDEVP